MSEIFELSSPFCLGLVLVTHHADCSEKQGYADKVDGVRWVALQLDLQGEVQDHLEAPENVG